MTPRPELKIAVIAMALCLAHASVAHAQGGAAAPFGGRQVFFSPAGEPFRAERGASFPAALWFSGADADADGVLTLDEFVADGVRFFAMLDTNKDGAIGGIENQAYEEKIAPEINYDPMAGRNMPGGGGPPRGVPPGKRPPGGGGPGGGGPPSGGMPGGGPPAGMRAPRNLESMPRGAAMFSHLGIRQPIRAADKNFDLIVSRAEFEDALRARFVALDSERTGALRLDDLPQTPFQKMASRARGRAP